MKNSQAEFFGISPQWKIQNFTKQNAFSVQQQLFEQSQGNETFKIEFLLLTKVKFF